MTAERTGAATAPHPREGRDRGSLTIVALILTTMCLGGGALIVDGGRALAARRHAANTAESAARYAVASQTLSADPDHATLRARAIEFATRAGVPPDDVDVRVLDDADGPSVEVTVTERTMTVFLAIGGASTMTVEATGSARFVYST